MKKTAKIFTSLVLVFTLMFTLTSMAFAINETEKNDSISTADTITVNSAVYGKLTKYDGDYFAFTINNPGYVSVTFNHTAKSSTLIFAGVYLTNGSKTYTSIFPSCDSASVSTVKMGLPAGTYYVRIEEENAYGQYGDNANYNFTVNYTQSNVWEREFNGGYSTANVISTGTTYYGSLTKYDGDYYAFTINKSANVSVVFNHTPKSSTLIFAGVYLTNGSSTYTSIFPSCDSASVSTNSIGLSAGTYYVRIEEENAYQQYGSDADYNFRVVVDGQSGSENYTLSYNANGGSGAPSSQYGNGNITLSSTVPTRNGYKFLGWSTNSSASTATYQPGSSFTLSYNTTLYAVWQNESTGGNDDGGNDNGWNLGIDLPNGIELPNIDFNQIMGVLQKLAELFKQFLPYFMQMFNSVMNLIANFQNK